MMLTTAAAVRFHRFGPACCPRVGVEPHPRDPQPKECDFPVFCPVDPFHRAHYVEGRLCPRVPMCPTKLVKLGRNGPDEGTNFNDNFYDPITETIKVSGNYPSFRARTDRMIELRGTCLADGELWVIVGFMVKT